MIEHTTLHNILTWVIAVILFIFQSLNYIIAHIKKYIKHGEKTTTVVTADTTISSESNTNNNNAPTNIITVQELIQKHFDIPLINAEDEPKVYNFIKSTQLLTSNDICKEKKKIDQFMENLVDDSYVARGLGLITATVGRQSEFYLYSKYDNNFENIVIRLSGRNGEIGEITILSENPANIVETKTIPIAYFYDKDRIKVTYTPFVEGVYTLTLVRNSLSICRSPYYISVEKSPTNSRSQIRLGTKKYKPVTKFAKAKHLPLETCNNSLPIIEISKPPICRNILPVTEEHSTRTDVMSMVTKFESNSINFQKKLHKRTSSIYEKSSETNSIDEISTYSNIQPKIETNNICNSDLNSPSVQSKSKSTDENFRNDVYITNKNSNAHDTNVINFETEWIKKPLTKLNENIKIKKDIPWVKNVSSTHLKPTYSVLTENSTNENSHDVKIHSQTIKTTEHISKNNHVEQILDPTTKIDEFEIKYIDNEPCLQNEVSYFDDDDRKTVVAMENNNMLPSNSNDTVIQQITDSAQYNINTPLISLITKISNSVCEKCSLQVLKIISDFPRDINITHNNNSNEIRSSFETLLAQPISININIDNMFEHPISATNEHSSEKLLNNNSPVKIKRLCTADKKIKYHYLNEIEPINNSSDELCGDINNMPSEFIIKHNEHNSEIKNAIKDKIVDYCTVPFVKNIMDKHKTVHPKNSATKEDNVIHLNRLNNNTTHKSYNEIGIQGRLLQKSLEHDLDLIKTDQFHEKNISKENKKPLDTNGLVTNSDNKNPNEEVIEDEFKINNVIIPDEHTSIQMSVINNTILASMVIPLGILVCKSKYDDEQTNIISNKNVTITSNLNENQKLMIEKSIEPVLTSFKHKIIEKITQLYLNKDLLNTDNTKILDTYDKHLTNNSQEIQINDIANNTEINTKYIETLTSQSKNHIDKNKISKIILDRKKFGNNYLFKNIENVIKTNINSSDTHTQTLPEIKLRTLVNTAMNHSNDHQLDNELKKMIIDNETQDVELKKINNCNIVQDMKTMFTETPNVKRIENTGELISSKNKVIVKTQCAIPLINDFESIVIDNTNTDIKHRMQLININDNETIIQTNNIEKKLLPNFQKSQNKVIITPTKELQPTLETQITNTSDSLKIKEYSSKYIQTEIEVNESNISEETDKVGNINNKVEYESVKLQTEENVIIKIQHMVEKEAINEIVKNISTNAHTKSNSTEILSIEQTKNHEIESPESKKVFDANEVIIEREMVYKSKPIDTTENIVFDKPNPQIITARNEQVSKNAAKVILLRINTSFSESTTVIDAPSEPDMKKGKILISMEAETFTFIDTSTTSLVRKIVVEFLTNKDKKQIETLANIEQKQIEDNILTEKETDSTINSLAVVMGEQVNTKKDVFIIIYVKAYNNVINTEQNNEKEHPSPINSLKKVVVDKIDVNIDVEDKKLIITFSYSNSKKEIKEIEKINITIPITLSTESIDISKEVLDTTKDKTPFSNSSTVTLDEEEQENNMNMSINTETKTILTIESIIDSIEEPTEEKDLTTTKISTCTISSIATADVQINVDIDIDKVTLAPINSSVDAMEENTIINSDTKKETLSIKTSIDSGKEMITVKQMSEDLIPIESTVKSVDEPKIVKDISENEISTCTDSCIENVEAPINVNNGLDGFTYIQITSSDQALEGNNITNTDTEKETLSMKTSIDSGEEMIRVEQMTENLKPIESIIDSTEEPKEEKNLITTKISTCTISSIATADAQINVDIDIDKVTLAPINSSVDAMEKNTIINSDTKKETLSIKTSIDSGKEMITVKQMSEDLIPIESTVKSVDEPKIVKDISENEISSCTDSSIENVEAPINVNNGLDGFTSIQINSSDQALEGNNITNSDTKKETLSIKTSIDSGKEMITVKQMSEDLIPIESTVKSVDEPKIVKDISENEITSCTDSSIENVEAPINVNNGLDGFTSIQITSSDQALEGNNITNSDTEKETLSMKTSIDSGEEMIRVEQMSENLIPIESIIDSTEEPKEEKNLTTNKISTCTISSIATADAQINVDIDIDKVTLAPINSSVDAMEKNTIINSDTKKETLSIKTSIDSGKEMITVKQMSEDLIPIESTVKSVDEPKIVKDISENEISSCTDSSIENVEAPINVNNGLDGFTSIQITSSDQALEGNNITNSDTKKETLSIKTSIDSGKEMITVKQMSEDLIPIESTAKSVDEPKIVKDISENEISTCTDSCIENAEAPINVNNGLDGFTYIQITSSDQALEGNNITNTDTEKETLSMKTSIDSGEEMIRVEQMTENLKPIESIIDSTEEPKEEKNLITTKISTCTISSIATADAQINVDIDIDKVTLAPINSSVDAMEKNTIINSDTKKETLSMKTSIDSGKEMITVKQMSEDLIPIESTVKSVDEPKIVKDISENEISSCTDSSIENVEAPINVNNGLDGFTSIQITSSDQALEGNNITNSDTERETLSMKTSIDSGEEMIRVEQMSENLIPIESIIDSTEEPKEEKNLTTNKISTCTISSIATADAQINVDIDIDKVILAPINSSVDAMEKNTIINSDTKKETLSIKTSIDSGKEMITVKQMSEDLIPIESTVKSVDEPKIVKDISENEISSCTDSSIENVEAPINVNNGLDGFTSIQITSSDQALEGNNITNSDTKKETLSIKTSIDSGKEMITVKQMSEDLIPIESTVKSVDEPKIVKDISVNEISSCTDSFIENVEAPINVNNGLDGFTSIQITSSDQALEGNNITNSDTEKETLSMKTSIDSGEEMIRVEQMTENLKPIESIIDSTEDPKEEKNLITTKISTCTISSIATADAQINVDIDIDKVTLAPINSSVDAMEKNTIINSDTKKETLSIKTSIDSGKEMITVKQMSEDLIPIESTVKSVDEPKIVKDISENEISSCTDSSIENVEAPINVNNGLDGFTSIQITSSVQALEGNNITNSDTKKETLSMKTSIDSGEEMIRVEQMSENLIPIESIIDSTEEPKEEKNLTTNKISTCTISSIATADAQINVDIDIDKVTLAPINSSVDAMEENTIIISDTKKETLSIKTSIDSGKEMITVKQMSEDLIPIESTVKSVDEPKIVKDISENEISSCTDSSIENVEAPINVNNGLDGFTSIQITSSDQALEGNNITNSDTKKETLSIKTSIDSGKEMITVKQMSEDLIPIESTVKSVDEPKIVKDISENEISTCTDSCIENVEAPINVNNGLDGFTYIQITSSDQALEGYNITNTDTEKETLSMKTSIDSGEEMIRVEQMTENLKPIESIIDSTEEPKEEKNLITTKISTCTISSIATADAQINVDIDIDKVTLAPINSSVDAMEKNTIINSDTKKETLSIKTSIDSGKEMITVKQMSEDLIPIESTVKSVDEPKIVKDISENEISSCTDSSIENVEAPINVNNGLDGFTSIQITSSDQSLEGNNITNSDTERETLSMKTSIDSGEEMIRVEQMSENLIPIESIIDSTEEPKEEKNLTTNKISTCTISSIATADAQINVDIDIDKVILAPINSSVDAMEKNTIINSDTKKETLSIKTSIDSGKEMITVKQMSEDLIPIESTVKSVDEPKIVKDISENEISSCTDSSIENVEAPINVNNGLDGFTSIQITSSDQALEGNNITNSDTKKETLSIKTSIDSGKEMITVKQMSEDLIPIESTVKSVDEPKIVKDISVNEISSCTDSFIENVEAPINVNNGLDGFTYIQITSSDQALEGNNITNTDTEKETLSMKTSIDSGEEMIRVEQMSENLIPIESIIDSTEEPKEDKNLTTTKISTCTISSIATADAQINVDINIDKVTLAPINSSVDAMEENTIINSDTKKETLLIKTSIDSGKEMITVKQMSEGLIPIESTVKSVDEPTILEDMSETEILFTKSLNKIIGDQKHTEKKLAEVSEIVEKECNEQIDTDNQLLLPINTSSTTADSKIVKTVIGNETQTPIYCLVDVTEEQYKMNIKSNNKTNTKTDISTSVEEQLNLKYPSENKHIEYIDSMIQNQTKTDIKTGNETLMSIDNCTESIEERIQVEVIKNELASLIDHSNIHDVVSLKEWNLIKSNTTAMITSVTVMEEQKAVNSAEVVAGTCDESFDKTILENDANNETPKSVNILAVAVEKQTDLEKVTENKIPILIDTTIKSVDKPIKIEKVTENETTTQITCEAEPKVETNEFEVNSGNETSIPVKYSASIAMEQTAVDNLTKRTLPNDDNMYRNTKTNLIDEEIRTGNLDNPNKCYLKFGETSKIHHLENEDNLQRKSYGIQKLEMSVQRMKTSNEDYYEKNFVQLEQTEKISNVDKVNVEGENKSIIDDKLYTVNESDLNAILCASSLEEALTLLDSKIKLKFKHKKSSSKIYSSEYIPKIQTSDNKNSAVNKNFTDAQEFFMDIEKKSKK